MVERIKWESKLTPSGSLAWHLLLPLSWNEHSPVLASGLYTHLLLLLFLPITHKANPIIFFILQMKKLRLRKVM
jgi:hypothetical protein